MAKKKEKTPAVAGVTPEEFQKLSPEEQVAYLNELQQKNAALESEAKKAKAEAKAKSNALPVVEVPKDNDSGVEPGTYQWTAPSLTWDEGKVIMVSDLMADAESDDDKVSQNAQVIIAKLLQLRSGLLVRKED